ncbi:nitrite reductase small subunit NirD [Saccharomonospora xinjiangensis]|uniref:nitrite reductase small subunit NirD n=1 Tax=Saccharomonospora xinjiangensis TaxID=75294 RepID=UPI00350EA196
MSTAWNWTPVCSEAAVSRGDGVAVLLGDAVQVAVFHTAEGEFFGLSNVDPFSGAAVLSRGIVGDHAGVPFVASPVYKQRFALRTGDCLDEENISVPTFPVRVVSGIVHVAVRDAANAAARDTVVAS